MSVDATIFVWKLPNNVITPIEKLILLAIADRCGERGECWPSISRLAADTGLDKRSIVRHRNKLINQNILRYTGDFKGRSNQIPVMQLMIDEWREGNYIEDEIDQGQPVTSDTQSLVPGAACHGYQGQPVIRNLKEEPKQEPKRSCAFSSKSTIDSFEEFWSQYPSKKAKKKCLEIWKRKKLYEIADEIIQRLNKQLMQDKQYLDGFVPNPSTYLNQERWNDEITNKRQSPDYSATNKSQQNNKDGQIFRKIQRTVMNGTPAQLADLKKSMGIRS